MSIPTPDRLRLALLAAAATLTLCAEAVFAQTLEGVVAEQGSLRPAPDAVVSLLRIPAPGADPEAAGTAVTDAEGRFRFLLPSPGIYRVQAEFAGLSSPLSHEIALGPGDRYDDLALLIPSRLLMMAYSCQAGGEVTGAAVVGMVRDPAGDLPLPQAQVRGRWFDGSQYREVTTEADAGGRYRLCNIPAGGTVQFRGEILGRTSAWSEVEIPRPSVLIHHLELPLGANVSTGEAPSVIQERILLEAAARGFGDLRGEILDLETGAPVAQAVVQLEGTGMQGLTDDRGRFLFSDIHPGRYGVRIQHLGYSVESEVVEVPAGRDVFLRIRIAPRVIELDGVDVSVRSAVEQITRLTPFRRDIVYGEAMLEEEIRGASAIDILSRSVPGLRVVELYRENAPNLVCVSTNRRVGRLQFGQGCENAQIVIDGVRFPDGPEFLKRMMAHEIESIEFLPPAQAQTVYGTGGNTANGVIVIWTRGKGPYVSPLRNPGRSP